MKIAFNFYFDETPLFLEVAQKLQNDYGFEIIGVTFGNRWRNELKKYHFNYYNISDYLKEVWDGLDIQELDTFETQLQYNLSYLIQMDRFLNKYDYIYSRKILLGHLKFWEKFFKSSGAECLIDSGVAFLVHVSCLLMANQNGKRLIQLFATRTPSDRVAISTNCIDSWDDVKKAYLGLKNRNLNDDETTFAEKFLNNFKKDKEIPSYMKLPRQKAGIHSSQIQEFRKRLKNYYFYGWRDDPFDYVTLNPFYYTKRDIARVLKGKIINQLNIFEQPQQDEKFILFPLHLQPEASTLVLAKYYVNQIAAIENIAQCLPVNYFLYVKEHYSSIGRRSLEYYRQIKKIPNVRLITPYVHSHDLIKKAALIIVLTSTMGWEGLLYDKPVVVLGNTFYNDSELTYRVNSFNELPNTIREALKNNKANRNQLLKFIHALFEGTFPGVFNVPHADTRVMEEQNVKRITEGIANYLVQNFPVS